MSGCERKRPARSALEDDQFDIATSSQEASNRPGVRPWPWRGFAFAILCFAPRALHQLLREPGLGRNVRALAQLPESETQETGHGYETGRRASYEPAKHDDASLPAASTTAGLPLQSAPGH